MGKKTWQLTVLAPALLALFTAPAGAQFVESGQKPASGKESKEVVISGRDSLPRGGFQSNIRPVRVITRSQPVKAQPAPKPERIEIKAASTGSFSRPAISGRMLKKAEKIPDHRAGILLDQAHGERARKKSELARRGNMLQE